MINLNEASRGELLNKSINARPTKSYGTTRYNRRKIQHIYNDAKTFNNVDMNSFIKGDTLQFVVPVQGEHDNYNVVVLFKGVCKNIQKELRLNNYNFEYKVVYRALIGAINRNDIFYGCSCEDWKYRFAYHATKGKFNAGKVQLIPAVVTNPDDDQGAGCKHVLKVLGDLDWAIKLASSITNYIIYAENNMYEAYINVIFPAIYGMTYDEAMRKGILSEPEEIIDDQSEDEIDEIQDDEIDEIPQEEEEIGEEPDEA